MKSLLFFCVTIVSTSALAWGPTGHRIVGEIAERHLTPQAAQAVHKILNGHRLPDVANWADDIKSDDSFTEVSPYHYADVSSSYRSYQEAPKDPHGDVVIAINAIVEFLRTGNSGAFAHAPALGKMDREQALKLLAHFVGDAHQPLHGGDPADKGGNSVHVHFMDVKNDTNLHAVWDDGIINHTMLSFSEYARQIDHGTAAEVQSWSHSQPADWINEDMAVRSQLYVYPDRQPHAEPGQDTVPLVSYDYIYKNRDLMEKRLLQGGVRLAAILNSIF
jgi:hypothetical protein